MTAAAEARWTENEAQGLCMCGYLITAKGEDLDFVNRMHRELKALIRASFHHPGGEPE